MPGFSLQISFWNGWLVCFFTSCLYPVLLDELSGITPIKRRPGQLQRRPAALLSRAGTTTGPAPPSRAGTAARPAPPSRAGMAAKTMTMDSCARAVTLRPGRADIRGGDGGKGEPVDKQLRLKSHCCFVVCFVPTTGTPIRLIIVHKVKCIRSVFAFLWV